MWLNHNKCAVCERRCLPRVASDGVPTVLTAKHVSLRRRNTTPATHNCWQTNGIRWRYAACRVILPLRVLWRGDVAVQVACLAMYCALVALQHYGVTVITTA